MREGESGRRSLLLKLVLKLSLICLVCWQDMIPAYGMMREGAHLSADAVEAARQLQVGGPVSGPRPLGLVAESRFWHTRHFRKPSQPLAYTALPYWLLQEQRWGLLLSDGIGHQLDATFWADLLPEVRAVSGMCNSLTASLTSPYSKPS